MNICVRVQSKLSQDIKLEVYGTKDAAIVGGTKFSSCAMPLNEKPLYFAAPSCDKALKQLNAAVSTSGSYLSGHLTLSKDEAVKKINQYPVRYILTESLRKRQQPSDRKDVRKTIKDLSESVKETKIGLIYKLDLTTSGEVTAGVTEEFGIVLPAMVARLQNIDMWCNPGLMREYPKPGTILPKEEVCCPMEPSQEKWVELISDVLGQILKKVDVNVLLRFFGTMKDIKAVDAQGSKNIVEKQRNALIEGYCKKGIALSYPYVPQLINPFSVPSQTHRTKTDVKIPVYESTVTETPENILKELDAIAAVLLKLVEVSDPRVMNFFVSYYLVRKFYSSAAKLLMKQMEGEISKELYLKLATAYSHLGFYHMTHHMISRMPVRFPYKHETF